MSDILERPTPSFDKRVVYGPNPQHFAEMRFPDGPGPFPLLLMIHGGFWQATYDLKHTGILCADLTKRGVVTCNIEYRRLGNPGGGWPGTFQDISLAADSIFEIVSKEPRVNMTKSAVMGHSAGGHLALWLVSKHRIRKDSPLYSGRNSSVSNAISLAGVSDLREGWKQRVGNGIVSKLMGGTPEQHPDRYDAGSPIELLPSGANQILVHGTVDNIVPISQSDRFVERAMQFDESPQLVRLDAVGHFEIIDPESTVWQSVVKTVLQALSEDR